ncbi:MAG TPA: RIP metalloprotease RseP [Prevotella sp.]|nr:RIP metalloprotease RseP [uncultured Prevotella sp.]HBF04684.1 RIP metalloprotease RseP [Candidatus Segatella violae]
MEVFLIKALQLMLSLSILVLLHEGGHFFFSKLFGVRVEKFYLFFDPWFHLFEFKPKNSDTTYGLGWLPLGGYCKISGMIDESFDTEQMKQPEQPYEFRSKPAWQRLLIMIGGVLVNFVLALFIYSMILFHWGDDYVSTKNMTYGMKFNSEAKALGFHDNDILVGSDQGEFKTYDGDLFRELSTAHRVDIIRGGKKMSLNLPGDLNMLDMIKESPRFVELYQPLQIDSVMKDSPASKVGLCKGDKILALNGKKLASFNDFQLELGRVDDLLSTITTHKDSVRALTANIEFLNAKGDTVKSNVLLQSTEDGVKFGFYNHPAMLDYKVTHISYGFFESFPAGVKYGWNVLSGYVGDMKYVFSKEGAKSLGGFGALGSLFPSMWDWHAFWMMTAFLSIILAFMNILPIPALDGGHVFFLLYEIITGRKPGDKFMERAEYVGFGILLLLLVVANLNDVLRFFGIM